MTRSGQAAGEIAKSALHRDAARRQRDAKAEAKEHGMDKSSTKHGHVTVTHLKMVSDSCSE